MGYQSISLKAPTSYSEDFMQSVIAKALKIKKFTYRIDNKSLDARNKNNIHWLLQILVVSDELKGDNVPGAEVLQIPYLKSDKKIVVAGSGPAGFFCAYVLQQAGFQTTLIERGSEVQKRGQAIRHFERSGFFDPVNNYAFGEGGAGTFSDGKLTSRSKHISKERQFILSAYVKAGGPEEIAYLAHPHLGTDNLKIIVKNLRQDYLALGGSMLFETMLLDFRSSVGIVREAITSAGSLPADALFVAPGHSAYDTYRMLMHRGVGFRTKNFALGSRMEHLQAVINRAQWGREKLPGVKAAEYRVTSPGDGKHQVYSFCMCPGGMVVPAAAFAGTNIVNGMSYYQRNGKFANAACVAALHPDELAGKTVSPAEALDRLEQLEQQFYNHTGGYSAPACTIKDFIDAKTRATGFESSFPLGLKPAPLWELLPANVASAMRAGLLDFAKKMRDFDSGTLIGLESKTSAPVQVIREEGGLCSGFSNLYVIGEGSGYAGGIISSAADGVRAALRFISNNGT